MQTNHLGDKIESKSKIRISLKLKKKILRLIDFIFRFLMLKSQLDLNPAGFEPILKHNLRKRY